MADSITKRARAKMDQRVSLPRPEGKRSSDLQLPADCARAAAAPEFRNDTSRTIANGADLPCQDQDHEFGVPRQHSLDHYLAEARSDLSRLEPTAAYAATSDGAILVDIRPEFQRRRDGEVPGALIVERNHLEWRLHPESSGRIPEASGFDIHWIVLCDEGYASSLAAASLKALGLHRATDVIGGLQSWRSTGLPLGPPGEVSPPRLAPGGEWSGEMSDPLDSRRSR